MIGQSQYFRNPHIDVLLTNNQNRSEIIDNDPSWHRMQVAKRESQKDLDNEETDWTLYDDEFLPVDVVMRLNDRGYGEV